MAYRKTMRHFSEVGHLHKSTFSCYRRILWLTNDAWWAKMAPCAKAVGNEAAIELVGVAVVVLWTGNGPRLGIATLPP
jgi:hypothetical protein